MIHTSQSSYIRAKHWIYSTVAIFLSLLSSVHLFGEDSVLFAPLLDSLVWNQQLRSYELDLKVHDTLSGDFPLDGGSKSLERSVLNEMVIRLHCVNDVQKQRILLVSSVGDSGFELVPDHNSSGSKVDSVQDSSQTEMLIKDKAGVRHADHLGRLFSNPLHAEKMDCLELARSMTGQLDIARIHLLLPQETHFRESKAEKILDQIAVGKGLDKLISVSYRKTADGKKELKDIRLKRPGAQPAFSTGAYRFVISEDGHDKGKIVEFHQGFMTKDAAREAYESEDQLDPNQKVSVLVEWKEFEVPDSDSKVVLPVFVKKTGTYKLGANRIRSSLVSFNWKLLSDVPEDDISVEKARAFCRKLKNQIDLDLKR